MGRKMDRKTRENVERILRNMVKILSDALLSGWISLDDYKKLVAILEGAGNVKTVEGVKNVIRVYNDTVINLMKLDRIDSMTAKMLLLHPADPRLR
jgi:hypothetical protein